MEHVNDLCFRDIRMVYGMMISRGGGGGVTPYILYGTDVPLELSPFFRLSIHQ